MLFLANSAHAEAKLYRYDTVHSQIVFSVDHNGFSRPFGRIPIAQGWLRFDPEDWGNSSTELDIDLAGIDMGNEAWNNALCQANFFNTKQQRYAHFASASVERKDDQHGILHGNLSFRGITHPLDIAFTWNRTARTLYGLHMVAGFSASTTLKREDYGINAYPHSIGHNVSIWLELEAIRDEQAQKQNISATE